MANLTELFTKFLFRETLTAEEKEDIRGDIGAGTVATTESVLALIDGEVLTPSATVFSDATLLALVANALAYDADGNLCRHNGTDNGGAPIGGKRLRGAATISGIAAATAAQIATIAGCRIPSAENVDASEWLLTGSIKIVNALTNWTGAITPRVGIYLIGSDGVPASQISVNRGYNFAWDPTQNIVHVDVCGRMTMTASGGFTSFTSDGVVGGIIQQNILSSTKTETLATLANGTGSAITRRVVSGDIRVIAYAGIDVDASGGDSSGQVLFDCDLRLTKI